MGGLLHLLFWIFEIRGDKYPVKEYDPSIHLSFGDIAVDSHENTSTVAIKIKVSKTYPYRHGITI